jgi:hypothetical protein
MNLNLRSTLVHDRRLAPLALRRVLVKRLNYLTHTQHAAQDVCAPRHDT